MRTSGNMFHTIVAARASSATEAMAMEAETATEAMMMMATALIDMAATPLLQRLVRVPPEDMAADTAPPTDMDLRMATTELTQSLAKDSTAVMAATPGPANLLTAMATGLIHMDPTPQPSPARALTEMAMVMGTVAT